MIQCTFENGNQARLRHITSTAIVVQNNQILITRRAEHLYLEAGKWSLPGGYIERDETLEQGMAREVLEETGFKIHSVHLLMVNSDPHRPREDRQNVDFVFTAAAGQKIQEPDNEVSDVQWFDPDSLPPANELAFDHGNILAWYIKSPNQLKLIGASQ